MKGPACPLCGGMESRLCFRERGYRLLACQACALLFIDPYPSAAADVHLKVSTYAYEALHIQDPDKHYAASTEFYGQHSLPIEEELRNVASVLDVGCGTGRLLELLGKNRTLSRAGIELNAARAQMARRIANCEIYELPLENMEAGLRFEAVTMINVWSHIPSIASLLASVRRLLTPNGKLILRTGECAPDVTKSAMYDWGIPDHLHFLGLSTLAHVCDRYGYQILRHDRLPLSDSLFAAARWRAPGRSGIRDALKRVTARTPLVLPLLRSLYRAMHGDSIYSSFVVLTPTQGSRQS